MLVAYLSGHGYGHMTRLCEVLRQVRERAPALPVTVVGSVPERLVRRDLGASVAFRAAVCDVGLVQRDALVVDEAATAERCSEFDARFEESAAGEAEHLRRCGARAVVGDIPPLAFAAAARAGVPGVALGNFSWDWIYRHLATRQPSLAGSAERAAAAYRQAELLLELPFAGDLSAFRRREAVGLVARRPRLERAEARRRLGLGDRPAVLVSFGGVGLAEVTARLRRRAGPFTFLLPEELEAARLEVLGLGYPDVVAAVDAVVSKPGYGIVSDAIAAGTRLVYTDRGDFPEYPILVREMTPLLACAYVPQDALREGRLDDAIQAVLELPVPPPPDLGGAARAAERLLDVVEDGRSAR